MLLGSNILGQSALGAISGGTSVDFVELSALIEMGLVVQAQVTASGFEAPVGSSVFASFGIADEPKSLLIAHNNGSALLGTGIAADAATLTVVGDISAWPSSGALTLDLTSSSTGSSEICYYDGIAGQVVTLVERGADSTTAKAFSAGARVQLRVIAHHHNLLAQTLIDVQTEVLTKADSAELASKADVDHTHTSSDITDLGPTFVAKSGDTMTGPLTLSGLPTSALHAATKSYIDSRLPVYFILDYNASGDMTTTTGSITGGSNQLSVASGATFSVGQGIYIDGAGAGGTHLITSITAIDGSVFTLATTASASRSNVTVQHDDTVAINTAMASVIAAGGGRLLFASGYYRCNGPIQSATNSILAPPYIPIAEGTPVTLSLEGLAYMEWPSWNLTGGSSTAGVIIQSDRNGSDVNAALFAMALWVGGITTEPFNNVHIYINDINFRTKDNPQLSGLDLGMAAAAECGRVHIDTGALFGSEPTFDRFAFRMPRVNTASAYSAHLMVVGRNYWTGAILAEAPLRGSNISMATCKVGFRSDFNYYPLQALLLAFNCPTSIHITDNTYADWTLFIESAQAGHWYSPTANRDIYDPDNKLHGVIRYSKHQSGTGTTIAISNTGATSAVLTNLRA